MPPKFSKRAYLLDIFKWYYYHFSKTSQISDLEKCPLAAPSRASDPWTSSWIDDFGWISAWLDENCRFFINSTFLCQSYFLLLIPYFIFVEDCIWFARMINPWSFNAKTIRVWIGDENANNFQSIFKTHTMIKPFH